MANPTSELSHSQYAVRRKELLLLVKQLRSIGCGFSTFSSWCSLLTSLRSAQADLDLPTITVIGNQSAGALML
jgi:hypothetical protein